MKKITDTQLENTSLALLIAIQDSIRAKPLSARFSLTSLARDLRCMGESSALLKKLRWLTDKEYVSKDVAAVYELTERGWGYTPPQPVKPTRTPFFDGIADMIMRRPRRADTR